MMRDDNGNPLFFIVDQNVYDKNGAFIDYMHNNYASIIKGTAQTLIVPDPIACSRYYIFTAGKENYTSNNGVKDPF